MRRITHPEIEGFTDAFPCLVDRASVGVTARHARHPRDPRSTLVALIDDLVAAHLNLRNHFLPRHGSRSRSIARSVPGGRSSPAWTGTVVRQSPHSTRTWYPVVAPVRTGDRKSTRLNSSHVAISYAVFCLKKKMD